MYTYSSGHAGRMAAERKYQTGRKTAARYG